MNDDNFYAYIAEEQDKKQNISSALKKILNYLEKETIPGGPGESEGHIPGPAEEEWNEKDFKNN